MSWRSIFDLVNGMIGKSIVLISLATPVSFLINVGIDMTIFKITLGGAILVLFTYLATKIFIPTIIISYKDGYEYAKNLMEINKRKGLDFVSEFQILEEHIESLPEGYDGFGFNNYAFTTIEKAQVELGEEICVRALSLLKYTYLNQSKSSIRLFITTFFLSGILLFYLPVICRLIKIYFGG